MSLFHLDWRRCPDGYRVELAKGSTGDRIIVPNSKKLEVYRPLAIPGPYRQLANCEPTQAGALKFIRAYGFLAHSNAEWEQLRSVIDRIRRMRRLVEDLDERNWVAISDMLERAALPPPRATDEDLASGYFRSWRFTGITHERGLPKGGHGRLGLVFELIDNKPILKFRPGSLIEGLEVQALSDAVFGIGHKKCKNPECDSYFPVSGPDAYRDGAEYHLPSCQRRHAYLKRKQNGDVHEGKYQSTRQKKLADKVRRRA